MKRIKTKNRYVPSYDNGSSFGEIAKFLKSQLAANKPTEIPRGFFGGSYALQGGALGSQIFALAGQSTREEPFIANPTDVSNAFKKVPVDQSTNLLDNFLLGQQRSLASYSGSQGGSSFDTGNLLAQPMANAANIRSNKALELLQQNTEMDRGRAKFGIEQDARVTAASNLERSNENQKLSLLGQKIAEGAGAFSNLNNKVFETKQSVDYMNNLKLNQLMNQLLSVNFYDRMYK